MSTRSRKFLAGLAGAVVFVFVIAAVAIFAFRAGRDSAEKATEAPATVIVSSGGNSVVIETTGGDQGTVVASVPEEDQPEFQQATVQGAPADEAGSTDKSTGPATGQEGAAPAIGQDTAQQDSDEQIPEDVPRVPVELDEEDVELLLEVWGIIDSEYDGQLPERNEVLYSAIAGSLRLLDDNTRFINPEMARQSKERLNGSFEGIGAFVDMNAEGYLVIVRPMEGQPADLAGIMADDVVTHVDGKSVLGMALEEITAEIKGPEGTEVTLTIRRESVEEPFDITLKRERIEIPIVSGKMLDENIAYVWLTSFSANASQQLEEKLKELLDQNPRGLVLDLRDNPGGFLSQAVDVADLFLGEGIVLHERDSRMFDEVFESEDGDLAEQIELVILVNAGSASASEIVAGAVQDRGRGILIGETTYGKGSVQQPHTLSNGSELRVTIAHWYTPNNQSISSSGIAPDISVETPDEFGTENDTQLQRAIQFLLDGR